MNYVTVNYSINQSYSIGEKTFIEIVNKSIENINYIKLISEPRIIFNKNKDNVGFVIDIKTKKDKNINDIINSFIEELEKKIISLLGIKPESIKICFLGNY
ncbi:MMB_0454 family protein [Mycoplasma sp. 1018B]|uniref:MMB_0454 family protein n=1 Tax=Mycoplasma sp. 1018B TaxID=2967302 RepID=UPI00211C8848|nr:hypothetical protein [Mycoplasma sp. 1018B]UUM19161.1 hypothetical protein NPA14_02400 [Mycoplasma sp. 1018B]